MSETSGLFPSEVICRGSVTCPVVRWPLSYHGDVIAIEQDLVQLCDASALGRGFELGHVLQDHVDKVVESEERAHDLLVVLHDNMDSRADGLVHQF